MEPSRPEIDANRNLRHIFYEHFVHVWLQSLEKVKMNELFFWISKISKFDDDSASVENFHSKKAETFAHLNSAFENADRLQKRTAC
jgi:hypothetical protein